MGIVGFIAVKADSERLPGKNLRMLGGKPLFTHILNSLLKIDSLDKVCVYSSDNRFQELMPVGCEFVVRDPKLDSPETLGIELFQSFAEIVESDHYLLAHSTSPFLRAKTMQSLVDALQLPDYDSAFTGEELRDYMWFNSAPVNFTLSEPFPRTQDLSPVIKESNGAYVYSREQILAQSRRVGKRPCLIPVSSLEAIDIDTGFDWELAKLHEGKLADD